MTLTLYGDFNSQPFRAVYVYCKINKIPLVIKKISIQKQEHLTPEYRKINPNGKVPALTDQDGMVALFESHTILRYIHSTRQGPDHWYPKDPVKRAKVDEYLDWHHAGLRAGAAGYFIKKILMPMFGVEVPKEAIDEVLINLKKSLKLMETYWLKDSPYLTGTEVTIADLSAACELAQTKAIKVFDDYPSKYPKVFAWLERMLAIPEMKEIHDKVLPPMRSFVDAQSEPEAKL